MSETSRQTGVSNAQWYPVYDLHAGSENGKPSPSVSLQYRVALSQSTGEIWNDTDLILSTSATDVLNAGIPTSESLSIEPVPQFQSAPGGLFGASVRHAGRSAVSVVPYSGAMGQQLSAPRGIVSKSPLSVTYTVEGKTTIPTDGQSHKVLVASLPLEATVTHVTTPRKSTVAYLQVSDLTVHHA